MADRIHILLVDDQPHFAELAKSFLKREDSRFEIDTATSPAAGFELLDSREYDCIVSDFNMPQTDGLEFFESVRDRGIDLPFILFSALDEADIEDESALDGVTAYLQKDGNEVFEDLAKRIRMSVTQHQADRELIDIQQRYDTLFEQSSFSMAWVDCNGHGPVITDHNEQFEEEFLLTENSVHLEAVLESTSIEPGTIEQLFDEGEPSTVTLEHYDEDNVTHYRWQVIPVTEDEQASISQGLIAAVDISEQATERYALERYRSIVEASGDPMYVLNMSGEFTYVNDALVSLSGYDRGELIGEHSQIVMSERGYETGTELIRELLRSDRDTGMFEMELQTANGQEVPCENHVSLIYDVETGNGDEVKGTAGVIRDITDRKQRITELRRHNERLEELAAFISHDLRNPLNLAKGNLELMEQHDDNSHLQSVNQALDRMSELLEDLLAMARSGQTVIEPETVELAETALLSWSNLSTSNATLEINADLAVFGDESRIRQLFENLFINAVEHGSQSVTVTVGELRDGFFVEDDGPGIPKTIKDDVFGHGFTTDTDGTGFGLSIVKGVADAHDWEVEIHEGETGGARFEFTDVQLTRADSNVHRHPP